MLQKFEGINGGPQNRKFKDTKQWPKDKKNNEVKNNYTVNYRLSNTVYTKTRVNWR
jgi:hypothetical protein